MKQLVQKAIEHRLGHYLIAGAAAFTGEYGSFLLLFYALHLSAVMANSISFGLGLIISFSLNKIWVFGNQQHDKRVSHQFAIYGTVALINLIITDVTIHYLVRAHVAAFIAKLVLVILVACWNFLIFKKIIFTVAES